jgi:hypothetical protein
MSSPKASSGPQAAPRPSARPIAERTFGAWLEKIESLPREARVEALFTRLFFELSIVGEIVELLRDEADARPGHTLRLLFLRLADWFSRAGSDLRRPSRASAEGLERRRAKLEASAGVTSVTRLTPTGTLTEIRWEGENGERRATLALTRSEADLLAELLEDHGSDGSGLAAWRRKDEVMKALRLHSARRIAPRDTGRTGRRLDPESRANDPTAESVSRHGWFEMRVSRLRRAIEAAGGRKWWVQSEDGGIRLAIRRGYATPDSGSAPTAVRGQKDR